MSRVTLVAMLMLVASCKKTEEARPSSPPSGGSARSGPADAGGLDAQPVAGALAFEVDPANQPPALAAAFTGKIPRLPALSADDQLLATFDWLGDGPAVPQPMELALARFPSAEVKERLPILTLEEAAKATGDNWLTPALRKQLEARGVAALARLRGFRSLETVELARESSGAAKPTKLGALTLMPSSDKEALVLELRDAKGAILQREQVEPYQSGTRTGADGPIPCNYTPRLDDVYKDPAKPAIYIRIGFRYNEECSAAVIQYLAWSLDPAAASPVESIRDVVSQQFDLVGVGHTEAENVVLPEADAIGTDLATTVEHLKELGVVERAMDLSGHIDKDFQVVFSRDGKSAWASELTSLGILEPNTSGRDAPWRASDVLVKTEAGWRIAALAWSEPRANADVNRAAKAGKLTAGKLSGAAGDAGLLAAFTALTTQGVDATASTRADLVALGSGPGERTIGGAGFARAWNAAWKGKVAIVSSIARAMPSRTTGWVAATVVLDKPGAKLPFTVFCVFDKDAGGAWSLVHIHFAVASPTA